MAAKENKTTGMDVGQQIDPISAHANMRLGAAREKVERLYRAIRGIELGKPCPAPGHDKFLPLGEMLLAIQVEQPLNPWDVLTLLLNDAQMEDLIRGLKTAADRGEKFKPNGRGPGAIRKAVQRLLEKDRQMTNAALWEALKSKPPRGHTFRENGLGRYIEGPNGQNTAFPRFLNVCSEARKDLRKNR
ncbi:MAG: hypothetical protein JO006_09175 [Paucibacter sp.]|nr:hypothetical protein [Roseateles sp.]